MTIGKNALSLKKRDFTSQRALAAGIQKVMFAHQATGGETQIDLSSLTTPSALSSQGFVQPSPGTLANLNIYHYSKNLTLWSSVRGGLVPYLSYRVTTNALILFQFTLVAGEIIVGVVDPAPTSDLLVVDGQPSATTGVLAIGTTDFNVGMPFEINKFPLEQVGSVLVFRNGKIQARCEGNSLVNDGNYIEVDTVGGYGTLIRFKDAPVLADDSVMVVPNGLVVERPTQGMMASIETLGGQINNIVTVLAEVSGLPTTSIVAAPNTPNLKAFGDTVLSQGTRITALESPTYVEGPVMANTTTGTADTYVDVFGSTIVLPSGVWELTFEGPLGINNNTAAAVNVYGNIGIFSSSDILQDSALAFVAAQFPAATGTDIRHIRITARVAAGTYKLKIRCTHNTATASVTAIVTPGASWTASFSDPDYGVKWYAKKVGV